MNVTNGFSIEEKREAKPAKAVFQSNENHSHYCLLVDLELYQNIHTIDLILQCVQFLLDAFICAKQKEK